MQNPFDVTGRRALITGAGRGIGREIARKLAGAGADIVVADLDGESAASCAEEVRGLGVKAHAVVLDVADSQAVEQVIAEVWEKVGPLDIAVNNAGISAHTPAEDTPDDEWHAVMDVNLHGVFYCCRSVGKRMLARGQGAIVNIASMSGLIVNSPQEQAAYNVSKAGVIMLTKSLAAEWGTRSVRVNSVSPGYIGTDMVRRALSQEPAWQERWLSMTPMGKLGRPDDVACAVWYLASDAAQYATGTNLIVDGGYTSW